jgi:hypothetical protein
MLTVKRQGQNTRNNVDWRIWRRRTFVRVDSHHCERVMQTGTKQNLASSVERYVAAIGGAYDGV